MTYRYPGGLIRRTAANTAITGASGVWDLGSQAQAVRNNTWPISGLANPISGSLRFRDTASPYLNRTPASAGNRRTWTWSGWVKRSNVSGSYSDYIFSVETGASERDAIIFDTSDRISIFPNDAIPGWLVTTQVFRDFSSWYHIVVAVDTTQATASNRIKLYVNGVQVTAFGTANYPTQNYDWNVNNTVLHTFGDDAANVPTSLYHFNGYMAEINLIDGQALTPASFGQTSAITGVWEPIKYTGTYGTNGFYLSLSDTSSIGKDFSGRGNNWSPNNFSTANDSTFDLMRDVPTQYTPQGATDIGGVVRGNYCTWNPLNKSSNHNSTNGNLTASSSGGTSYGAICATMGVTSGKWYWEMTYTRNGSTNSPVIGFGNDLFTYTNPPFGYLGSDLNGGGINVFNGNAAINATSTAYGSAIATNDVVMFAMDLDNRKFYIGKNGTWFNSGNPVSGTNQWPYSATIVGSTFFPAVNMFNDTGDTNFGQRPFAYTPPSGFKALCTTNLPTPTIGATAATAAGKYFNTVIWTGTGGTRSITGVGFQPDFVWAKARSQAYSNILFDSNRGVGKNLLTDTTGAEATNEANGYISSFDADGFSSNFSAAANYYFNQSGTTYVAWNWNAGGSTVTNTAGSISSQVRANPTAGFSIVTYTGNGTSGATVGHGLGVAPSMYIVKTRSTTESWITYHISIGATNYLALNLTQASSAATGAWNNTAPTSTVFSLGNAGSTNGSGSTFVAYCFAPVAGYSAFGSYTGNDSTNGPFVYTGFRPRYVLIKKTATGVGNGEWYVHDTARDDYNQARFKLYPSSAVAENGVSGETTTTNAIDILSNGFKLRTGNGATNQSAIVYIYAAFAEFPFKYALAR